MEKIWTLRFIAQASVTTLPATFLQDIHGQIRFAAIDQHARAIADSVLKDLVLASRLHFVKEISFEVE
jgi:hypothetical protein